MNQTEAADDKSGRAWVNLANIVIFLIGLAVLTGYTVLLRRLPLLDMGPFSFQFFPIPWYTVAGEFLFILLLITLAMWHVKLAWTRPPGSGWRECCGKWSQLAFAAGLLLTPLLFRAVAEILLQQING